MTGIGALPSICVVCFRLDAASETFVHRHIYQLNGGNTVVVVERAPAPGVTGKPLLLWPQPAVAARRGLLARWRARPKPDLGTFPEEFARFAGEHGVGAVLCEFGTVGIGFYEIARRAGLAVFCYFRGYDASKRLRSAEYRREVAEMLRHIDGVVTVSVYLLERLRRRGLVHPNSHVIPSGVDTPEFLPGEKDSDLVLAVGRMIEKKAPFTTVKAFAKVAARHPTIRLEMIGDGWMLGRVRKLVERLGLGGRITLHGAQDHEFVAARMKRAAIFMQHSVTSLGGDAEGAPTAIQEAMTAGAAVLSTRHAGIPELIEEGVTGLLVRERDLADYTRELERLVADPVLRARLGAAAHAYAVEQFDYRKLYKRLEAVLGAAIAARTS
jgi:glycosyltransferase involved in cell wall biosynthesis